VKAQAVDRLLREQVWAINPAALERMFAWVASHGDAEITAPMRAAVAGVKPARGGVAVIPMQGTISNRPDIWSFLFGGASCVELADQLHSALADPSVARIVLDIDSPGGTVDGITELAAEILAARAEKPIIAVVNTMAASAAYWLASQATEVIMSPSAQAGSIGVFNVHMDKSKALAEMGVVPTFISAGKFKTEGNPFEPLSADAKAAIQERVDSYYGMFTRDVAKGRGVPVATVRDSYGQGRVLGATDAVAAGMADRVMPFSEAVGRNPRRAQVADPMPQPGATTEPVTLAERCERLATDTSELLAHAHAAVSMRAKESRGLGTQQNERIDAVATQLLEAAEVLRTLTKPAAKAPTTSSAAERSRFVRLTSTAMAH